MNDNGNTRICRQSFSPVSTLKYLILTHAGHKAHAVTKVFLRASNLKAHFSTFFLSGAQSAPFK